jgi:hypothetical protein
MDSDMAKLLEQLSNSQSAEPSGNANKDDPNLSDEEIIAVLSSGILDKPVIKTYKIFKDLEITFSTLSIEEKNILNLFFDVLKSSSRSYPSYATELMDLINVLFSIEEVKYKDKLIKFKNILWTFLKECKLDFVNEKTFNPILIMEELIKLLNTFIKLIMDFIKRECPFFMYELIYTKIKTELINFRKLIQNVYSTMSKQDFFLPVTTQNRSSS